jgi:hypothetical protein
MRKHNRHRIYIQGGELYIEIDMETMWIHATGKPKLFTPYKEMEKKSIQSNLYVQQFLRSVKFLQTVKRDQ